MAKILDKIFPSAEQRLIPVRRNYQWTKAELDSLSDMLNLQKEKKLGRLAGRLNKKMKKSAFAACDKEMFASYCMEEKLQKYDIRQYLSYRAANHGCARRIFSAIHRQEAWQEELQKQQAAVEKLLSRRNAYVSKLEAKKSAFLEKNTSYDDKEYQQLKARLEAQYCSEEKKLDEICRKKQMAGTKKLNAKIKKYEAKMDKIKASSKNKLSLPQEVLLSVKGLKMYFGGLKAVDDLSFDVKKGEIFGLIGPNGAGKTTVFNCITRFYDATDGEMYFENKQGEVVNLRDFQVHDVILQGITRTFQNVELVKEISVLENLLVACTREYRSNLAVQALGLPVLQKEERILKEKAKRILKFMGLENYASWLVYGLPYGILKKVEIARALMSNAKLIIMDEPAAGLNDTETAELTETIRRIRDEFHVTILLVEHDMSLVMNVCDTVYAISFGKMLAIGTCEEIKKNKAVQEAYLGIEGDV